MSRTRAAGYAKNWDMIGFLSHTSQNEALTDQLVHSKQFKALDKKLRSFPFTDPEESG